MLPPCASSADRNRRADQLSRDNAAGGHGHLRPPVPTGPDVVGMGRKGARPRDSPAANHTESGLPATRRGTRWGEARAVVQSAARSGRRRGGHHVGCQGAGPASFPEAAEAAARPSSLTSFPSGSRLWPMWTQVLFPPEYTRAMSSCKEASHIGRQKCRGEPARDGRIMDKVAIPGARTCARGRSCRESRGRSRWSPRRQAPGERSLGPSSDGHFSLGASGRGGPALVVGGVSKGTPALSSRAGGSHSGPPGSRV